ncbi:YeaH/YhbH family protein [Aliikangiella sp. IMCC44359]|uniref:YeaH/YhbH family protein n=1 Tax=Aliikangiella sp. IMCC44359 TaxID=3459125 RepID=UPI00403AA2E5
MQIIDRRLNQKNKSTVNRQRFLRRYRKQIKQAITKQISQRGVTDIDQSENISIPSKDIGEPTFRSAEGGVRERIYPGNKEFDQGDRIKRPPPGGGQGGKQASDKGEGQDEFAFEISSEEYMEILFEDLELPNLKKNKLKKLINYKPIRSGFNTDGTPSNIDIVRSLKGSLARRIACQSPLKKELSEKEALLKEYIDNDQITKRKEIELEIEELNRRIRSVPYLDSYDLRYKNFDKLPQPTTNAVMFCLMDVSGSMDQQTKDMAKRFFILLYMFLKRTYKDVEVVYIRHHTQAKEVDEEEFFYSQETGGTIVSSALKLMQEIIHDRYPADDWNIYAAQASDGDNWNDDSRVCHNLLSTQILKTVRYYTYVEITQREPQNLWHEYVRIKQDFDNFAMQKIAEQKDIYPVFREFFQKQSQK